ncbi:unnamed protein product [Caenorhabditis bovis]|uniref:Tetraspanin n=1 Tax=Caenorhabditis bovis TaxID=2654633 RepID=A0A8S1EBI6_9PELO|nr:unnamed protein product [Caenorhabditis bovis]
MISADERPIRQHPPRSVKCAKCATWLLLALSYMLVMIGCVFLVLGTWLVFFRAEIIPLLHSNFYICCIYLAVACGTLNVITGSYMHCTLTNRCAMGICVFIIFATMILEGGLGFLTTSYMATSSHELEVSLKNDILTRFGVDDIITNAINHLQKEGRCCGSTAFNDYPKLTDEEIDEDLAVYYPDWRPLKVQYIPDSCCKSFSRRCARSDSPSNIYYRGCLPYLQDEVKHNLNFIFITTAASFILLFLTLIVSCIVCVRQRDFDDMNNNNQNNIDMKDLDQELFLFE